MTRDHQSVLNAVRIYHVRHDSGSQIGNVSILDEFEQRRATRLANPCRRKEFLRRRVALRCLLADEIGCSAAEIRFFTEANGKPVVSSPRTHLHFSTTTSKALTLIAVSDGPVGIDCEFVREDLAVPAMAEFVLTASELRRWSSLPQSDRALDFFVAWTRKEAVVKANGQGLGNCPPDAIDVMSSPTSGLHSFVPRDGYIAALSIGT